MKLWLNPTQYISNLFFLVLFLSGYSCSRIEQAEVCFSHDDCPACHTCVAGGCTPSKRCSTSTETDVDTDTPSDGVLGGSDCHYSNGAVEDLDDGVTCRDGVDNDCDGFTDEEDLGCGSDTAVIYRSVGAHHHDLNVDGAKVVISHNRAAFSSPLPKYVGVGDVIQYRVDEQNVLAFITERIADDRYLVSNSVGNEATSSVSTSAHVFRAYHSLDEWQNLQANTLIAEDVRAFDTSRDLTALNVRLQVACYADDIHKTRVTIKNWQTSAENNIRIFTPYLENEVGISQRHDGRWSEDAFTMHQIDNVNLTVSVEYAELDGIQFDYVSLTSKGVAPVMLQGPSSDAYIEHRMHNCMVRLESIGYGRGIFRLWENVSVGKVFLWNNIVYSKSLQKGDIALFLADSDFYVMNNTVYGFDSGIFVRSGAAARVQNNVVQNSNVGYTGGGGFDTASTHNISSIGDAPGNAAKQCNVLFVDASNIDFRLAEDDTCAYQAGKDASSDADMPFDDDIANHDRQIPWSAGAFQ